MSNYDPDAPFEGRLGSIMPRRRSNMVNKNAKMKFIPKLSFRKKEEKEILNNPLKKEKFQSIFEKEEILLDLKKTNDEKVKVENESKDYLNIHGHSSMDSSELAIIPQRNIMEKEINFDEETELFESDEDGVSKINMEKLNIIASNNLYSGMLPVSSFFVNSGNNFIQMKKDDLYNSTLKGRNELEMQISIPKDESKNVYIKEIKSDSTHHTLLTSEIQENTFKSVVRSLNDTNICNNVLPENQEKKQILDDFNLLKHQFLDELTNDTKNSNELLFFQFPPILPILFKSDDMKIEETDVKIEEPEIKIEETEVKIEDFEIKDINMVSKQNNIYQTSLNHNIKSKNESTELLSLPCSDQPNTLTQWSLPNGCIGQLKIHQSGKTTIVWGGIEMNVSIGSECKFLQDIVAIDYKINQKAWLMGKIKHKYIYLIILKITI
ncbi:unnamed protein product [Pneumocystis jirovecii]|uniref:DNA-directed RNA polymerase III subunit RPC4 n=1 Tax=Pneumocystis jirovecii TaxID=42068 RepID=L0PBW6_PNEJI|nr:unnamed protein product [Pneumocystis jirovecii]CCJ31424.1 unnamed protein product [Pneumocystis jirovecii]